MLAINSKKRCQNNCKKGKLFCQDHQSDIKEHYFYEVVLKDESY